MKKFNKSLYYFFVPLMNSISFWIIISLAILSSPLSIVLSYFFFSNILYYSSFIISIVEQVFVFVVCLFMLVKLFNENKYNFSDVKLLGKNYNRSTLYWSKFTLLMIVVSCLVVIMTILNAIVAAICKADNQTIGALSVSNFIGLLADVLIVCPLITIICCATSKVWSPLIAMTAIAVFPITSVVSNFLLNDKESANKLDVNINDNTAKVRYGKIYQLDNNNKFIDFKYVYNINNVDDNNAIKINKNLDIKNSINPINYYSNFLPGNFTMGFQESIFAGMINDTQSFLSDINQYSGSLSRIVANKENNLSSFLSYKNKYFLTNLDDANYFSNTANLYDSVKKALNSIIAKDNKIANDSIALSAILDNLKTSSTSTQAWNMESFNREQIQFLFDLLGADESICFYLWYYQTYFNGNIGNIIAKLKQEFKPELINLIDYLYCSKYTTYSNIFLFNSLSDPINQFYNYLLLKYPVNFNPLSTLQVSDIDLDIFSNKLVVIKQLPAITPTQAPDQPNSPTNPTTFTNPNDSSGQNIQQTTPNNTDNQQQKPLEPIVQISVLNNKGVYIEIDKVKLETGMKSIVNTNQNTGVQKLEFKTQQDWINFINNNPTPRFLSAVRSELMTMVKDLAPVQIDNLSFNANTFNSTFELNAVSYNWEWYITLITFIGWNLLFFNLSYFYYSKCKLN